MATHIRDLTEPDLLTAENERKILMRIIGFALVFKLLLTLILPLGLDEAYAIAVAQEYSLSFFDHPPISFWAPVAFADLTGLQHIVIYRLPFVVAGVLTTWMMYLIGREIAGSRAGVWSALLYTVAPYFLVSGGFMAVPDGMLNFGLAFAVLYMMRIVKSGDRAPIKYWVLTGLGLAFALGSKYQAAWLPVAVLLFMLITPQGRRWFVQPGPWIGGIIGLLGLLPVVLWNLQNDWISLGFHTSRAGDGFSLFNLQRMLITQAIFLLPTGIVAAFMGLWPAIRRPARADRFLLALIAVGPILIFNYVYLTSTSSHAHWTMPGWMFALPLAAAWLADRDARALKRHLRWTVGFLALIWLPLLLLVTHSQTGFLTRWTHEKAPNWDDTLLVYGFDDLELQLQARGLWQTTEVFMARGWAFGGIFDTALKSKKPMRVFDEDGGHHFPFLSDAKATGQALYLEATTFKDSATSDARVLIDAQSLDANAELLAPIILTRGGLPYVHITLVQFQLD